MGGIGLPASSEPIKNPFGGTFNTKSNNNWLFSGGLNATSNQQQGSSIFGGNTSGFTNPAPSEKISTFGGTAFDSGAFSSPVSNGSGFGSGPTFGTSAFRNRSDAHGSVFGGNTSTPAATSTPVASGFSAFANKSSAFNQLAGNLPQQTSPQQNSSMFAGNVGNSSFSLYNFFLIYFLLIFFN